MRWTRGIYTALAFVRCPGCHVETPAWPNERGEVEDSCFKCGELLQTRLNGWDGKLNLKPLPVLKTSAMKFDPLGADGPGNTKGT